MLFPLLGLTSTLQDPECDRVTLTSAGEGAESCFSRSGQDAWTSDDEAAHSLSTHDLVEAIQERFGEDVDRVECCRTQEKVVYSLEHGTLRVERGARDAGRPGAESHPVDLGPVADALGIPRSKRKRKLKQATEFARIVQQALGARQKGPVRILDLACGRSYLGFVLAYQLAARGLHPELHGVDSDPVLVDKCRQIAAELKSPNCAFEAANLSSYSAEPKAWDVVLSLHACDTLTDEAIRVACRARAPFLFVAPCCHHEMRHSWKAHPLQWIARYGLLEQGLADVLTDGFRCVVLEALGYRVKVLRFAAPDVTPKNLLIQAELTSGPNPERASAAWDFMKFFGVRPRLAMVLEAAGLRGARA